MWQIVGPNGVTNTTGGVAVPLPEAPVPPDTAPRHAGVGATVQTAAQTTVHPAVRAVTAVDATRPVNFGPLKRLAADPRVTDILVTCDGAVWVERGLGIELEHPSIPLDSPAVVRRLAVQLCAQLGERLDDARPIADASGADGTRVHAVIAPVVPYGASISIRLPSRMSATMDALQQAGCWPAQWRPILDRLVLARANILITGSTGSGKTTLLKALLLNCRASERIVLVEEVRELQGLGNLNTVSLCARAKNVEGAGEVTMGDLVRSTLRMYPTRVVVGECRGEEVIDLMRVLNSGHCGGMSTLHASGVSRVPGRLISLGLLAHVEPNTMAGLADGAFDVVLHMERRPGKRYLAQIGMLCMVEGRLVGRTVSSWDGRGEPVAGEAWRPFAERWGTKRVPERR